MTDWRDAPYWRHLEEKTRSRKAVTGPGVLSYQNSPLLSSISDDPVARAAAFLRAYKVGWFYKAESKISADIAKLDVTVAPEDDSGDNETVVLEPDLSTPWERLDPIGQFLRLMEQPNPRQTGRQLRQKTQIRIDMAGWTFWYLENAGPMGSGVLPTAIYGISPARLTPSFDKAGQLLGWVLDADRLGGGVPFEAYEILQFANPTADDSWAGIGVVEAVWAQLPLSDQLAKHTSDLLSTGGRLAGMLWPKERSLEESEFQDAQRAWRNVASDPNAARRLLLFPEPMEYAVGASTPAEIGIPELAALNRDEILTAFPISPYQLGVPMPGGLNSAQLRVEDRRDYWEGTIGPRVDLLEETIQVGLLSLYEAVLGTTYDFDIMVPNLDDAVSLTAKAAAMSALVDLGFTPKSAIEALQLDALEWVEPPPPPAPMLPPEQPMPETMPMERPKSVKASAAETARDRVAEPAAVRAKARLARFFAAQRARVIVNLRTTLPASKAARMKVDVTLWWDPELEDDELRATMREIYADVGRGALMTVADTVDRIIPKGISQSVIGDLLEYGGQRIKEINERTLQALTVELAEGTRRGYSIPQLIDGVPDEGYRGVMQAGLDNGVEVWSELRAETIARTETMLSYNRATIDGYSEFGITHLLAYDGDEDPECAERNGQEFTIDEASAIDDHPNGTLVWSPVVDKSYRERKPDLNEDEVRELVQQMLGAQKSAPMEGRQYVINPPPPAPIIVQVPNEPAPVVQVQAADFGPLLEAVQDVGAAVKAIDMMPVVSGPAVTDVRIVDDVSPPKVKRVIRGPKSRQYPAGPIEGIEE